MPEKGQRLYVPREAVPSVAQQVHELIEAAPPRTMIGINLREIALMPSSLWKQLGPLLHARATDGTFGADKRILYLTGGDSESLASLQAVFANAAVEASTRGSGKLVDRAALAPADRRGYVGILRKTYEEVLFLVNRFGSVTTEDVVREIGRYSPNNASNYLAELDDLGLIIRDVAPRPTGGFASRAYALSVPEEAFRNAVSLV
jgi:hypothetical protein